MIIRILRFTFIMIGLVFVYFNTFSQSISAGFRHSLFLCDDSTIYAAGMNDRGQLGDSTIVNQFIAVPVKNMTSAVAVAGGDGFSIALKADGTLWEWGTFYSMASPDVPEMDIDTNFRNIVSISAGMNHYMIIKSDSSLWSSGFNDYGQAGCSGCSNVTFRGFTLDNVWKVACGLNHTLALKYDSTVWACGQNDFHQVSDMSAPNIPQWKQVNNLTGIVDITAASAVSMALKADGTVWQWGMNTGINPPAQVTGLPIITKISVGDPNNPNVQFHAIAADSTLWSWGSNLSGQLGLGTISANVIAPVQVPGMSQIVEISSNWAFNIVKRSDGFVYTVGSNSSGQLGQVQPGNNSTYTPISFCGSTTSVEDFIQSNVLVYPNPASNEVFIKSKSEVERLIQIYDMCGKLILEKTIHQNFEKIDVSSMAIGVYVLRIGEDKNLQFESRLLIVE